VWEAVIAVKVHKLHNLLITSELEGQKYHFVVVKKMFDEIFDEVNFFSSRVDTFYIWAAENQKKNKRILTRG
jgi:hypothetical protein